MPAPVREALGDGAELTAREVALVLASLGSAPE
jgi:hypothetical protein